MHVQTDMKTSPEITNPSFFSAIVYDLSVSLPRILSLVSLLFLSLSLGSFAIYMEYGSQTIVMNLTCSLMHYAA